MSHADSHTQSKMEADQQFKLSRKKLCFLTWRTPLRREFQHCKPAADWNDRTTDRQKQLPRRGFWSAELL